MAELYKSVTELMKTARGNKALQGNLGDITDFQQIIDDTPTADVEEVNHGEYIYSSTDDKWHCSECFAERPRNNGEIPYSDIYCCYKCGAKMDGGKAE